MPTPIPLDYIVLAWAEFSPSHQLLRLRTDETLDELLIPRQDVATLEVCSFLFSYTCSDCRDSQKLRVAVNHMYGIMPDSTSPGNIWSNSVVAVNMGKASGNRKATWEEMWNKRVFNVIYVEGGDDGGAFDVRVSFGRWRV